MKQLVNNNCKRLLEDVLKRLTDTGEPFAEWDVERLTGGGNDDKRLSNYNI